MVFGSPAPGSGFPKEILDFGRGATLPPPPHHRGIDGGKKFNVFDGGGLGDTVNLCHVRRGGGCRPPLTAKYVRTSLKIAKGWVCV